MDMEVEERVRGREKDGQGSGVEARAVDWNQSHIIRIRFSGSKDLFSFECIEFS